MASSLEKKQVDELLAKYRTIAEREQRRVDELEEQNAYLVDTVSSSLLVPSSAFVMSFARAYYGETASVFGLPIDAAVGLLLKGFAALLGFAPNKGAQTAAKIAHDVANGALASWTAARGAELGLKKRMEKPVPLPPPNAGAENTPKRAPEPATHKDLEAINAAMALQTQPAMPEQPLVPAPLPTPAQVMTSATPAATSALPPTPQKPFRFTQRWAVNPEADMRALLQSLGAPSDSNTVMHLLSHENPSEELKAIVQRARAPA